MLMAVNFGNHNRIPAASANSGWANLGHELGAKAQTSANFGTKTGAESLRAPEAAPYPREQARETGKKILGLFRRERAPENTTEQLSGDPITEKLKRQQAQLAEAQAQLAKANARLDRDFDRMNQTAFSANEAVFHIRKK